MTLKLSRPDLLIQKGLINGEWLSAKDTLVVTNPATGETVGEFPNMGAAETTAAVEAAHRALPAWRDKTPKERAEILLKWHHLTLENVKDLAAIMTAEQGKPLAEAEGEIRYASSFLQWFGEEAKRLYGETVSGPRPGTQVQVTLEPVGVAAMITPWNFPTAMITRKVAAALAAGCTAVIKPSELTPFSATAIAQLAVEAGVPDGVLNVVAGDPEQIGGALCRDARVRKLSFTGSTRVGKLLAQQCADTVKKISLELGGNAPFIVFDDADLDLAADQLMLSKFRNAGQTCVCANRVLVQEGVYEAFLERLVARVDALKVGDGTETGVTIGPLINQAALEKVERHIADAVGKGARVLTGGKRHGLGGTFHEPTVLADVPDDAASGCEETFGPVAPVSAFKDEAEAVTRANDTPYGLASYFCTRDLGRAMRVTRALEAGIVGVNEGIISAENVPFGGVKESGVGREGARQGIHEYLEVKYALFGYPVAP